MNNDPMHWQRSIGGGCELYTFVDLSVSLMLSAVGYAYENVYMGCLRVNIIYIE